MTGSRALATALLLLPAPAAAHAPAGELAAPLAGPLAAALLLGVYLAGAARYRRRRGHAGAHGAGRLAAGLAGAVLVLAATSPPAEALIGASFARHMAQHMFLLLAAPALLAAGRLDLALAALLPRGSRLAAWTARLGARPVLVAHGLLLTVWLWHRPGPWLLAERNDLVHAADHAMLLAASVLYWQAGLDRFRAASLRPAASLLASLVLIVGTGFLGAVLTLAPVPLYGPSVALADQQLGGIVMWVPGGLAYAAVLLWTLDRWLARLQARPHQIPDEMRTLVAKGPEARSHVRGLQLEMVELPEATLRVRHGGCGPPVLLLHGHPRTHATWHRVAPLLASSHTVICPDLRGFGESSKPVDAPITPAPPSAPRPGTVWRSCAGWGSSASRWSATIAGATPRSGPPWIIWAWSPTSSSWTACRSWKPGALRRALRHGVVALVLLCAAGQARTCHPRRSGGLVWGLQGADGRGSLCGLSGCHRRPRDRSRHDRGLPGRPRHRPAA